MRPSSFRSAHSTPTASGNASKRARNSAAPRAPSSSTSFGSSPQRAASTTGSRSVTRPAYLRHPSNRGEKTRVAGTAAPVVHPSGLGAPQDDRRQDHERERPDERDDRLLREPADGACRMELVSGLEVGEAVAVDRVVAHKAGGHGVAFVAGRGTGA